MANFHRLKLAAVACLALVVASPASSQVLTPQDFGVMERLDNGQMRFLNGAVDLPGSGLPSVRSLAQTGRGMRNIRMAFDYTKMEAVGAICSTGGLKACAVSLALTLAASYVLSKFFDDAPDATLQAQRDHTASLCGLRVDTPITGDCNQPFKRTATQGGYTGYTIAKAAFFPATYDTSSACNTGNTSIDAHYQLFGVPRSQHYDPNKPNTSRIPHMPSGVIGSRCHLIGSSYKILMVSALNMYDDVAYNRIMSGDWDGFRNAVSTALRPGATGPLDAFGRPMNTLTDLRPSTLASTYFRGSSGQLVSPWGTDADGNMYMPDVFLDLDPVPDAVGPDDRSSNGRQLMTGTRGYNYETGLFDNSTPDSQAIYDSTDTRYFLPTCSFCNPTSPGQTETDAPPMEERPVYQPMTPATGNSTGTTTTTTNPDGSTTTTTNTTINLELPSRFAVDVMSVPAVRMNTTDLATGVATGVSSVTAELQGLRGDLTAPIPEPTDLASEGSWLSLPSFSLGTRWLPATCPAPRQLSIMGKTHSMSFQPFCDIAGYLSILVLASAALSAFAIAFGGGKK